VQDDAEMPNPITFRQKPVTEFLDELRGLSPALIKGAYLASRLSP